MEILKCIYNNQISDFIVKRTCITIKNHTFEKTLGFFDIRYYIYDNKLFIEDNYNTNLIISGNNAKLLYKTIKKKMSNLRYEIKLSDLIINNDKNIDFQCIICLENKNTDIIKLKCCNNILHYNCYLNYVKTIDDYRCPICRNDECPICFGLGC
tara:strand:- start:4 stop:465 length:462 start_codon:yes stop_codon:yes gene_type:complete